MNNIDIGSEFKKIRRNKNLTQSEVCSSFISRTTLSKIENNTCLTSIDKFNYLLEKVEMSFDEFFYISNNYTQSTKNEIINSFFSLSSNSEKNELLDFKSRIELYLESQHDIFLYDILSILGLYEVLFFSNSLTNSKSITQVCQPIFDRLMKMDKWYYNEIRLVNCILFFFPLNFVILLSDKLIKSIRLYNKFKDNDSLLISIYLNLLTIYLYNEKYDYCKKIIEDMEFLVINSKRYDFYSVFLIRKGIIYNENKFKKRGFSIIEAFEDKNLLIEMQKEVEMFNVKFN